MSTGVIQEWAGEPVTFWTALWRVPHLEIHARVGSTNDRARELARDGGRPYTTVIAREQTSGRGRNGAPWHSAPDAGLWMSVLLPEAPGPHVTLLVGLAVAEALEARIPGLRPRLEWPNDLTVQDRKLGGILCESAGGGVVAGIGINTRTPLGGFPAELASRATALDAVGAGPVDIAALAGAVLDRLRARIARAGSTLSSEEAQALRARDALEGRAVLSEEHGPGRAMGIAPDGSLILASEAGSHVHVRAGHVRPAS